MSECLWPDLGGELLSRSRLNESILDQLQQTAGKRVHFLKEWKSLGVFRFPGVYVLCNRGQIAYIGTAKYLLDRLLTHHLGDRYQRKVFDAVYYFRISDTYDRYCVERKLIESFRPPLNKTRGETAAKIAKIAYRARWGKLKCEISKIGFELYMGKIAYRRGNGEQLVEIIYGKTKGMVLRKYEVLSSIQY